MEEKLDEEEKRKLTGMIRAWSHELGFVGVGIVPAIQLTAERSLLDEWLRRDFHAGMEWMARDPARRTDPSHLLPGAKSVIVVLENYFTPHAHSASVEEAKISRYAWGDDYHEVVGDKLNRLLEQIISHLPEVNGKICVDTSPMMDKAWAVRAGLGWIGKHTNLITREFGSWVFIGEIIVDVELDFDIAPEKDRCGTCTACIDACPTGAIAEPYVVDSNRCISYGTIEHRGTHLPEKIEKNLSGWIYGCDICQDVCPWNRFEKPTDEARFEPRKGETSIALDAVLDLEPQSFAERFKGSAAKRAKLEGWKRNAETLKRHRINR